MSGLQNLWAKTKLGGQYARYGVSISGISTLLYQEELRYPDKNDRLFIEGGNPDDVAWLNKAFQQFGDYVNAYQTAALSLMDKALEDNVFRDSHIYPTVFLIRQYLELRLKELIQGLNYLSNRTFGFPEVHDIRYLWGIFIRLRHSIEFSDITEMHFDVIGNLIDEMASVDPGSFSFRYPVDKRGNKTQKLEYVNLVNLKETFDRMSFVLDGYSDAIERNIEFSRDQLNDLYSEYH